MSGSGGDGDGGSRLYRSVSTGLLVSGPYAAASAGVVAVIPGAGLGVPALESSGLASAKAAADAGTDFTAAQHGPLLGGHKFQFERLNLTINELGEHDGSGPILRHPRHISMFWQEKIALLLFYLQIHGLIWLQCYEFYPQAWREYWRWTLIFILDVHNLIKDAGGSNTGGDTAFHTFCIMLLPVASLIVYELLTRVVYKDRIAGSTLEDPHRISYCTFQQWALMYAELLYIPVLLVWLRTWTCGSNNHLVLIYRDWTCWESPHILLLIFVTALSGFFTLMLPYLIYTRTRRIVVFHDPQLHERYLQSRELEYLIGCNNLYEYTQFYMIASYKRVWSWTRLIQLGQKALLCVFLIALSTYNAGDALLTQAVLFVIVISAPAFANVFYRSFRCSSSNYLKAIFDCVLFFTCIMDVITADIHGYSSSFLDPSTFSYMMLMVNCVGLAAAIALGSYHYGKEVKQRRAIEAKLMEKYRRSNEGQNSSDRSSAHGSAAVNASDAAALSAVRASAALMCDGAWPTVPSDLVALYATHPEMIATLNLGKRLLEDALTTPEEFYPRANLIDAINAMRTLLQEAKCRREGKVRRSLLLDDRRVGARPLHRSLTKSEERELARVARLGEERSRALEWTLQDMVEDLALLYNTMSARAAKDLAASGGAATAAAASQARFERMSGSLAGFSESLASKQLQCAMMHPAKRAMLSKLLTIKALLSAGNEAFVYGERPPWAQPLFLPSSEPVPAAQQHEEEKDSKEQQSSKQDEVRIRVDAPLLAPSPEDLSDEE